MTTSRHLVFRIDRTRSGKGGPGRPRLVKSGRRRCLHDAVEVALAFVLDVDRRNAPRSQ